MKVTKREPGRPTLCTPEMVDALVVRVRAGVPIKRAVGAIGISESAFYKWMERGEAGESPYVELMERVTRARNQTAAAMAEVVVQAGLDGDVKAAQWYLERRDPQHWGKSADTVVNVNTGPQVPTIDASVTVEELEAELEEMSE